MKIKLNTRLISHGQIGVKGMVLINDSLGESLVGEKNWQTISDILLTIVLSPIPGEVKNYNRNYPQDQCFKNATNILQTYQKSGL